MVSYEEIRAGSSGRTLLGAVLSGVEFTGEVELAQWDESTFKVLFPGFAKGTKVGAEASTNKIFWSELDLQMHETAMRMHPHLRGTSFLSASPEPPLAVLTRVLGRRATHGWRAVACRGSSDDEQLLQVVPPSAQLADEARRLAAFATRVLDLPVEARIPPPPVHDSLTTGVSP